MEEQKADTERPAKSIKARRQIIVLVAAAIVVVVGTSRQQRVVFMVVGLWMLVAPKKEKERTSCDFHQISRSKIH